MLDETMRLQVANTRTAPIRFCLEPYGATSLMPPGSIWTVTAQLPAGNHLAVEMDEAAIIVRAGEELFPAVTVTAGSDVVMDYGQLASATFDPYK